MAREAEAVRERRARIIKPTPVRGVSETRRGSKVMEARPISLELRRLQ